MPGHPPSTCAPRRASPVEHPVSWAIAYRPARVGVADLDDQPLLGAAQRVDGQRLCSKFLCNVEGKSDGSRSMAAGSQLSLPLPLARKSFCAIVAAEGERAVPDDRDSRIKFVSRVETPGPGSTLLQFSFRVLLDHRDDRKARGRRRACVPAPSAETIWTSPPAPPTLSRVRT